MPGSYATHDQRKPQTTYASMIEMQDFYATYEQRLQTFYNWLHTFPAIKLASAGFICMGEKNVVIGRLCLVVGCKWREGDNPLTGHLDRNPYCPIFNAVFLWLIRKQLKISFPHYICQSLQKLACNH